MKIKEEVLGAIYQKFPQHMVLISELFEESDNFRSLCEDYHDCVEMLTSLADKKGRTKKLIKEYSLLLSEIEQELEEEIMSHSS